MTKLADLIAVAPTPQAEEKHRYEFYNKIYEMFDGLLDISNQSQLITPDFSVLSAKGLNPTTPADGDNTEFVQNWFVVGAANANYTITPTVYPTNSTVRSSSQYFVRNVVTSHNGNAFYFYQRQLNSVRKYQKRYMTFTLVLNNNQNKIIKVRTDIYSYYDTANFLAQGKTINIQPGMNDVSTTILLQSLSGITVGANDYTEFRLNFTDLINGTADINLYSIKCEYGKLSTPLVQ